MSRDIICIGASTGGLQALKTVVADLPRELPAALFIVLHQPDSSRSHLTGILRASGALPVEEAIHGQRIERGRIYVAPPDAHLLVREGQLAVVRGPRENGHRPAVNPLFRTAAEIYGQRVVGVVLTGALDCGTTGLLAIKARGGIGVAQNPFTAVCEDMPASAVRSGAVDHVVELGAVAPLLVQLAADQSADMTDNPSSRKMVTAASFVTCPHCNGSMTETGQGELTEFACHVGHKFSLRNLYSEQAEQVEAALWAAIRALEESTSLAQRLERHSTGDLRARFGEKARGMQQHAETLRAMILGGAVSTRTDVTEAQDPSARAES